MLTEISSQAQFDEEANKGTSFFTFAPDFYILEINTFPVPLIYIHTNNICYITVKGNSNVYLSGSSISADFLENSSGIIDVTEVTTINCFDDSHVILRGLSYADCYDNSQVTVFSQGATAHLYDNSTCISYSGTVLVEDSNATVRAYGQSFVGTTSEFNHIDAFHDTVVSSPTTKNIT